MFHQIHPIPYNTHQPPRLHHLAPTSTQPKLHLRQPIQPRDPRLRRDFQIRQTLAHRGQDIRQGKTFVGFEGVDGVEAGRDVRVLEEGVGDEGDVGGVRGGDAVVDGSVGDGGAVDGGFGRRGLVFQAQRGA